MPILNPENREVICFIHRGRSPFLECAVAQAFASGYLPIVIGDEAARCRFEVQHFDITQYFASAQAFADIYQHRSVNPYDYELFCFQRWFIAQEFLKSYDSPIWFSDHDILLFPGLEQFSRLSSALIRGPIVMNSAWLNYISSKSNIEDMTEYFTSIQKDISVLDTLTERFKVGDQPVLSDMHAIIAYAETLTTPVLNTAYYGSSIGLDENFRLDCGYNTRNGHKLVEWVNGLPHCRTTDGKLRRFYSFHFQGPSKVLMGLMHRVTEPTHLSQIESMGYSVASLSDDELGRLILNEYEALSAAAAA